MRAAGFHGLGLNPEVLAAIEDMGFEEPTPIQAQAIPILLEGRDLIGKAETGTGKTLAFCAPIIGLLDPQRVAVQSLILCPTRELAQQVEETASALGRKRGIRTALLVGGVHQARQILSLREGAQVAVGTPGRVLDFLGEGILRLGWTSHVVLDEADRMLDMGFIDDVSKILSKIPPERQTLMFSATVPPRLKGLSKNFMRNPTTISTTQGITTVPEIRQLFVKVHPGDKEGFILDLLDEHPEDTCIVFCNTRREVIDLDRVLWGLGYTAGSLHGEHEQERRFRVLEAFKERQIRTLVATDVAGRGLDIEEVTRVVNYDVPEDVETYVHRIGRTGRAGGLGESITLVTAREARAWEQILRTTGFPIEELSWTPTRPRKKVRPAGGGRSRHRVPGEQGRSRSARGGGRPKSRPRRDRSPRSDADAERSRPKRRKQGEASSSPRPSSRTSSRSGGKRRRRRKSD